MPVKKFLFNTKVYMISCINTKLARNVYQVNQNFKCTLELIQVKILMLVQLVKKIVQKYT